MKFITFVIDYMNRTDDKKNYVCGSNWSYNLPIDHVDEINYLYGWTLTKKWKKYWWWDGRTHMDTIDTHVNYITWMKLQIDEND
jgi:hypothetical protein